MIRVTVIVPARDAEATLPRTLAALADQEGAPSYEVVVADQGSGGTAAAASRASGALFAFCGADCVPEAGWLAAGARALANADVVQGALLPDPRAEPGPFDRTYEVTRHTGLYDPGSLFATRSAFDRLGGFETGLLGGREVWLAPGAHGVFCAEARCRRPAVSRDVPAYLEEATRVRDVPAMVARVPELRDSLLHRRLFLSERDMKLNAALAGLIVAARRRSALPLLAALPYALELRRHARERGGEGWVGVASIDAAADVLGTAALLRGSAEARTLVL